MQVIQDCGDIGDEFIRYTLSCYDEGTSRPAPGPRQAQPPRRQPQMGKPVKMTKEMAAMQKKIKAQRGQQPAPAAPVVVPPVRESRQEQPGGEVREFIKDPFGKAYLPGSSLKGCLRTALAYTLVKADAMNMKLVDDLLENNQARREWAFSKMSADLFCGDGKGDAKADILKTLLVRDSEPLDFNAWGAMTYVRVMNDYRGRFDVKSGMPIRLETIMPGKGAIQIPFSVNLRLMELDRQDALPLLQRAGKGKALSLLQNKETFENALRLFSKALLEHELAFYQQYRQNAAPGLEFIQRLMKDQQDNNSIYLDLGFSTGWHTKTIGMALDEKDISDIRAHFGKYDTDRPNKNMGSPGVNLFPKTRKWAKTADGYRPLGWIKLEIIQN
ncbi:MAG: RAMP superfamily protein [Candidatus Hydrogenedentes bacterium ADurb.Bin101]|nr:MAG: RAMP superfamily protein [Candidatus Hydrogenedentes bacterium ADurb.Bin101]